MQIISRQNTISKFQYHHWNFSTNNYDKLRKERSIYIYIYKRPNCNLLQLLLSHDNRILFHGHYYNILYYIYYNIIYYWSTKNYCNILQIIDKKYLYCNCLLLHVCHCNKLLLGYCNEIFVAIGYHFKILWQ